MADGRRNTYGSPRKNYQNSDEERLKETDSSEHMENLVTALNPLTIGGYHNHPSHNLALPYRQQQMEQTTESKGNRTQANETQATQMSQRSTPSQHSSPRDVINYVHRSAREETSDARAANTEAGARKREGKSETTRKASESAETRRVYSEGGKDTLCILDSQGRALEPGDALLIGNEFETQNIYVGNQKIVHCPRRGEMVVKKELACPFRKMTVHRWGECQVFTPSQRVDRATAWIGKKFNEGDERRCEFSTWIYTGMGIDEAKRKGFWLFY